MEDVSPNTRGRLDAHKLSETKALADAEVAGLELAWREAELATANADAALEGAKEKRAIFASQRDAADKLSRRGSIEVPGLSRRRNSKEVQGLAVRVTECDTEIAGLEAA